MKSLHICAMPFRELTKCLQLTEIARSYKLILQFMRHKQHVNTVYCLPVVNTANTLS